MATVRKAIKNIASGKGAQKLRPSARLESDNPAEAVLVSLPNVIPTQYPPLILVHVLLLSAALVLLPQTPLPDLPLPPPPRGLDKPQHPFLVPITARPVLTLAWACLGATLLVPWWAGSLRSWVHDGTLGSCSIELRLQGDPHKRRVRPCLSYLHTHSPPHPFRPFPNPTFLSSLTGHLECVCLHRLHCPCAACSNHFVRSAIRSVRLYIPHVSPLTSAHPTIATPRYVPHTALLSLLLAIYTAFPPAYTLGPPRLGLPLLSPSANNAIAQNDLWVRIFAERK